MATKSQIIQQIGVIEKKLPNGEAKELHQDVTDFCIQVKNHQSKMDKFRTDMTEINNALKLME